MRFSKLWLVAAFEACAPTPSPAAPEQTPAPRSVMRGGVARQPAPATASPCAVPSTSTAALNCAAQEIEQRAEALRVFVQAMRR